MGSRAYTVRAMTAVALPTPERGIRKPSMEMDGMVYRKFITANVGLAERVNSLISMPATPPMTMAMAMAVSEISRCSQSSPAKKSQRLTSSSNIFAIIGPHPSLSRPQRGRSHGTARSAGSAPAL